MAHALHRAATVTSRLAALGLALLMMGCAQEHQYLSYEAAEQVCVALSTCVPRYAGSPGGCALARQYADANEPGVYRCILAAHADCDAVRACLGLSFAPVASCAGAARRHCEGNTIVDCVGGGSAPSYVRRQRCGAPELPSTPPVSFSETDPASRTVCVDEPLGDPQCIVGTPCDFEGDRCTSSTHGETCAHGVLVGAGDCAPGFVCRLQDGTAECRALGEPCIDAACDRGRLRVCGLEAGGAGHLWPFDGAMDCAALGLLCDPHRGCVPPGTECDPSEAPSGGVPACDGAVLSYCGGDGHIRTYDCVAHGWGGCRATDGSAECFPVGFAPP